MPPLDGAVYPPRVEPPTFAQRFPRWAMAIRTVPWVVLTVLMVDRLRTEGFSWFVVIGLVIAASNFGYHLAKLDGLRPDTDA